MPGRNWSSGKSTLVIIAAVVIGFGILLRCIPVLADRPLWYDEVRTWQTAYNPAWYEFFLATVHKDHPPLSYLFVRAAMEIFGPGHFWAMRLPSLIFGVLCIPVAFTLGNRLISSRAGFVLACLVSVNHIMIVQSQQARMYTLFMLLFLLALHQLVLAVERNNVSSWMLFGAFTGLLGWTHQLALIVWGGFAAGVLFLLWESFRSAKGSIVFRHVLLAGCIALVINIPPLLQLLRRMGSPKGSEIAISTLLSKIDGMLGGVLGHSPFYLLVLLVAGTGMYFLYRNAHRYLAVTLGALFLLSLVAQFPLSRMHHHFSPRYMIPLLLPVWLGLVAALFFAPRASFRNVMVAIVMVYASNTMIKGVNSTFKDLSHRFLYGKATDYVMNSAVKNEPVIFYPSYYKSFCAPYGYLHVRSGNPISCIRSEVYFRSEDIGGQRAHAGVWCVVWPAKMLKKADLQDEFICQLERIASDFDLDFHISDPASIPRRNPLIFHFMPDSLDIFTVKAVSASRAEVVPLSRDVIR